ncbi:HD domain-containing phosphohydrolase [Seleniivibrio woodruffii]|uniref:Putative two-component system response regulator/two-component system response regulator RpfG n=1 Tax=Seleniivibrio woodruffii TaxID=1078050 RepID=A0A4R1KA95_9BACT|nr:HD domain-containing phosphohydrolase [Seleniivibrio woodruffii]TCK60957.1 putative two-component system response regulator/two-component system response regulator RpfG [Seleniivibrio woodruffii]TVZ36587.1 putative two-component system response regulator/two-component system response regulator RpfG [Seleniivibrio woodruffii]
MGINGKIVSVDDNKLNLMLIESMLESMHLEIKSFTDPRQALHYIRSSQPDLILTDYMMPDMDGISLIRSVREFDHDVPMVMITAVDDDDSIKLSALNAGASDFLYKPLKLYEFQVRVKNLLSLRKNQLLLKDRAALLQQEVEMATEKIRMREFETLTIIGRASEYKDTETGNHIKRVAHYSKALSEHIGMDPEFTDALYFSAPLHDIGKLGIPDSILLKPGKLDVEEFAVMKQHTTIGYKILADSEGKYLKFGAEIALSHHERWDGKGYPQGLAEENIPICGRIVAVSDVFDALLSKRTYKEKWQYDDARQFIKENSGVMFDPCVVDAFDKLKGAFLDITRNYEDD